MFRFKCALGRGIALIAETVLAVKPVGVLGITDERSSRARVHWDARSAEFGRV